MRPLKWLRSRGGRFNKLCNLEKSKFSVFPYLITSPNYSKSEEIIL